MTGLLESIQRRPRSRPGPARYRRDVAIHQPAAGDPDAAGAGRAALLVAGHPNKVVGHQLEISPRTVEVPVAG